MDQSETDGEHVRFVNKRIQKFLLFTLLSVTKIQYKNIYVVLFCLWVVISFLEGGTQITSVRKQSVEKSIRIYEMEQRVSGQFRITHTEEFRDL
jgi:hypothetical protein